MKKYLVPEPRYLTFDELGLTRTLRANSEGERTFVHCDLSSTYQH